MLAAAGCYCWVLPAAALLLFCSSVRLFFLSVVAVAYVSSSQQHTYQAEDQRLPPAGGPACAVSNCNDMQALLHGPISMLSKLSALLSTSACQRK